MMNVWVMWMLVCNFSVHMPVVVRLCSIPVKIMRVLMVLIMCMAVRMVKRLMLMFMFMALS
jgi:hypothetical protein